MVRHSAIVALSRLQMQSNIYSISTSADDIEQRNAGILHLPHFNSQFPECHHSFRAQLFE